MVVANRLALAGLAALAVSMTGVILLVSDILFSTLTTGIATVLAATMFGGLWFVAPGQAQAGSEPRALEAAAAALIAAAELRRSR